MWPHLGLLYLVRQRHGVHIVVHSTFHLTLHPNELSPVLYWYLNALTCDWPDTECGCPSLMLVDTRWHRLKAFLWVPGCG